MVKISAWSKVAMVARVSQGIRYRLIRAVAAVTVLNRTSQSIWWCNTAKLSGLKSGMNVSACSALRCLSEGNIGTNTWKHCTCTGCWVREKFMILTLRLHRDENKLDMFKGGLTWPWPSFIEDVVCGKSSAKKSFSCFNLELLFSFLTLENCKVTLTTC